MNHFECVHFFYDCLIDQRWEKHSDMLQDNFLLTYSDQSGNFWAANGLTQTCEHLKQSCLSQVLSIDIRNKNITYLPSSVVIEVRGKLSWAEGSRSFTQVFFFEPLKSRTDSPKVWRIKATTIFVEDVSDILQSLVWTNLHSLTCRLSPPNGFRLDPSGCLCPNCCSQEHADESSTDQWPSRDISRQTFASLFKTLPPDKESENEKTRTKPETEEKRDEFLLLSRDSKPVKVQLTSEVTQKANEHKSEFSEERLDATIYVSGLTHLSCDKKAFVKNVFKRFGAINSISILNKGNVKKLEETYAFVWFESKEAVERVIQETGSLHKLIVGEIVLHVDRYRKQKPRCIEL